MTTSKKMENNLKKIKMEDDLKKMEDDLKKNGRQPQKMEVDLK
jgi:hypothetical protein